MSKFKKPKKGNLLLELLEQMEVDNAADKLVLETENKLRSSGIDPDNLTAEQIFGFLEALAFYAFEKRTGKTKGKNLGY